MRRRSGWAGRSRAAVDALIQGWTRTLTKDEVARRMLAAKVPCAPVRNLDEVIHDENMHARGSLQWIDHPELGRVALPHSPLVFEGAERVAIEPSRPLGASNDEIFGHWLGHCGAELEAWRAEGVIGAATDPPADSRFAPSLGAAKGEGGGNRG